TGDLGGVDDAGLEHVLVVAGGGVETLRPVEVAHPLDHDAALIAGVGCDLLQRLFERPGHDARALALVAVVVVGQLLHLDLRARPSMSRVTFSSLSPTSSEMTWPPARMAMSWSMALRRSPKPGALTATDLNVPRILLTTRVARASPSTSSAMITSGLPDCMTFSSTGSRSRTAEIFDPTSRR